MGNGHSASIGFCFPSNEVEFACRTYGMRALLSTTRCEWDTSTVVAEVTGAALSISPLSAIGSAWRHWAKSPILLPIPPHLSFHGVVKVCRGGGTAAAVGAHTGRHGQCWTESAAGALLTLIVPEGGTGASCCLCWKTNGALFQNFSCAANVHCNCKRSQTRGRCFRPRLRGRGAAPMRRCGSGRPSGCAL